MKIISQEELEKSKENVNLQIDKLYSSTNMESDDERNLLFRYHLKSLVL